MQTINEDLAAETQPNVDYNKTYTATIQRQNDTDPWGLRLRGGSDCNDPATVHQVRRKSPASKAGVKEGDLVELIDNVPTNGMTHQQIADILASSRLTLELLLTRQTPVESQGEQDKRSTNEYSRQRDDVGGGSLNSGKVTKHSLRSSSAESKRQAVYNLAHRVQLPPPTKGYQPYDLLGSPAASTSSPSTRQAYQCSTPTQQPLNGQPTSAAGSQQTNSDNNGIISQPSPQIASPHVDFSYDSPQIYYLPTKQARSRQRQFEDAGVVDMGFGHGTPRQSKSFLLIETALAVQGSGETGLPPPRSASREQEKFVDRREQLYTEWM